MKNAQRFAGAPRGLYRSQDLFADLQMRAIYLSIGNYPAPYKVCNTLIFNDFIFGILPNQGQKRCF
jgi:hypothetical protein